MTKYRKIPEVVEAHQLFADNSIKVARWSGATVLQPGNVGFSGIALKVNTASGPVVARSGDYIVRTSEGSIFVCGRNYFERNYEPI